jgi:hypothetical protein
VNVGGTGVPVSNTTSSATQVTATFTIAGTATPGIRSVTATTAGGTRNTVNFTVTVQPPPTVAGTFNPISGNLGQSVVVTLAGSNFVAGATTINFTVGTGITASNVTVLSSTSLRATLNIASNANVGDHFAKVTTPGGTSSGSAYFEVYGAPAITSIVPNIGSTGSTVSVQLNGVNFSRDSMVRSSVSGITISGQTFLSDGTVMKMNFIIAAGTPAGPVNVSQSRPHKATKQDWKQIQKAKREVRLDLPIRDGY